ncbi:MAG: Holliday junction resolvase RecU [Bacilli bacterium]|nr:Holliday junction resolvase RecU [Bacilli bacterium]
MKHPCGIVKNNSKMVNYANRGMGLEGDINLSNAYYLVHDKAIIHKKPTPITIQKVDYPSRLEAVIKEAYFKTPSTTDYNGIYKGRYIDFEAKETKNTSFPLANIHIHQIEHLKKVVKHGGIAFIIIRFTQLGKTFYLKAEDLFSFIETQKRKSIPLSYFEEKGHLIKDCFHPRVCYLDIIDTLYFGG